MSGYSPAHARKKPLAYRLVPVLLLISSTVTAIGLLAAGSIPLPPAALAAAREPALAPVLDRAAALPAPPVSPVLAAAWGHPLAVREPSPSPDRTVRIRHGDTLAAVARRVYGREAAWPVLYWANHRQVRWADQVSAGLVLKVPVLPATIPDPPHHTSPPTPKVVLAAAGGTGITAAPVLGSGGGVGGAFGACVRMAENGGSYAWGTGNGGGAYQFLESTWVAYGGSASSWGSASAAEQDRVFMNAIAAGGQGNWSGYDGCSSGLSTQTVGAIRLTAAHRQHHRMRLRERAYQRALSRAGAWYCWGGTGPCYDCSGLVFTSYLPWINIGRDTYSMLASGRLRRIPASQRRQGDLAFFGTGHVELVAGKHYTFGAHRSGEPVSLRPVSPWSAPTMYFRVAW